MSYKNALDRVRFAKAAVPVVSFVSIKVQFAYSALAFIRSSVLSYFLSNTLACLSIDPIKSFAIINVYHLFLKNRLQEE